MATQPQEPRILILVFLLYALALTPLGNYQHPDQRVPGYYHVQQIDPGDDTGYYAYLRSGIIDGDFDFYNERGYFHFNKISDTGYTQNFWYIGAPLLWLPFFLIGHAVAWLYQTMGYPVSVDGYSFPYYASTYFACVFEVFLGLLLCHETLKKIYPRFVSLATTLLVFTATCLPYFTFIRNRMSHTGDVLVGFAFLLLFLRFRDRPDHPLSFFALWGMALGLLVDLRYVSVVYAALPLGLILQRCLDTGASKESRTHLMKGIGLAFLAFLVTVSPQLAAWKMLHGVFSSQNPYTWVLGDFSSFMGSLYNFFFGATRGLAITEPVWVAGMIGLLLLLKRDRWLGGVCWVALIGFSTAPIAIGDPATFAQRYLLPALPLLALGLGEAIHWMAQKNLKGLAIGLGGLFSFWMYVLIMNYNILLPYNAPQFAYRALTNIPDLFSSGTLVRPTSLPDLLFSGKAQLNDHRDLFFLIVFPLGLLLIPPVCRWAISCVHKIMARGSEGKFYLRLTTAGAVFFAALTLFIVLRHPELPAETQKQRLQMAAIGQFLAYYPQWDTSQAYLDRAREIAPDDPGNFLIQADAKFILGEFVEAEFYYQKARALKPFISVAMQLERVRLLLRKLPYPKPSGASSNETMDSHRRRGFYWLDAKKNPEQAMKHFQNAIKGSTNQNETAGLTRLIRQYQWMQSALAKRNVSANAIPAETLRVLNTVFFQAQFNKG